MQQATNSVTDRVQALTEEVTTGTDLYVVAVKVRGARGSQVVDIVIDSDDGPTLDELAEVSREAGFLIDTEDLIADSYDLNVSSPGADEPLRNPRQFKKNVGRDLFIQYDKEAEPEGGVRSFTLHGTLEEADDESITMAELKVSKDKRRKKSKTGRTERITYDDVTSARIELPW